MKTVTDKYIEMNHNFIELRDSIMQKIKDEKPMENGMLNNVFIAMGVLNHFLDIYKEMNEVKTKVKEDDKLVEGEVYYSNAWSTKCGEGVILSNPHAWE